MIIATTKANTLSSRVSATPACAPAHVGVRARDMLFASALRLSLSTLAALLCLATPAARAQDWFRTGTGLGVSKPKVAVADFVSRNDASTSLAALFSDVVRNDLDFSGIVDLASKSF